MTQFCDDKGIKREYSVAKSPQQYEAEAVNTACYVLNRALVTKPHNKTPYKLNRGRHPLIYFMKPFGYPVTILNTRDYLGKFKGKADEGYFVGYSVFCDDKGIKREYSVAKSPQQYEVGERRNRTLIEATRTMLFKSKLPTTF
nr:hypothetical protein [Tanacetum cinerariifolium]